MQVNCLCTYTTPRLMYDFQRNNALYKVTRSHISKINGHYKHSIKYCDL